VTQQTSWLESPGVIIPRLLCHTTALQVSPDPFSSFAAQSRLACELMTCAARCFCPGLHMLLHLSVAPINLRNVGQDLESKCCSQISHSLARHFPTSACKNGCAPLIMSRLWRLSPSSFVLSSFNTSVVAIVIVITIIAIVVVNATTVPILTSVKTVVGAIVAFCLLCRSQGAAHTSMCAMPSCGPSFEAHLLPPLLPCGLCSVAGGDFHPEWSRAWSAQCFQGMHPLTLSPLAPPLARPVKHNGLVHGLPNVSKACTH